MHECYPDKSKVAREILAYLSASPDAQDTLDGIVQWWLKEKKSDQYTMLVKEVLGDLVTQGRIRRIEREGHILTYRVHAERT